MSEYTELLDMHLELVASSENVNDKCEYMLNKYKDILDKYNKLQDEHIKLLKEHNELLLINDKDIKC